MRDTYNYIDFDNGESRTVKNLMDSLSELQENSIVTLENVQDWLSSDAPNNNGKVLILSNCCWSHKWVNEHHQQSPGSHISICSSTQSDSEPDSFDGSFTDLIVNQEGEGCCLYYDCNGHRIIVTAKTTQNISNLCRFIWNDDNQN